MDLAPLPLHGADPVQTAGQAHPVAPSKHIHSALCTAIPCQTGQTGIVISNFTRVFQLVSELTGHAVLTRVSEDRWDTVSSPRQCIANRPLWVSLVHTRHGMWLVYTVFWTWRVLSIALLLLTVHSALHARYTIGLQHCADRRLSCLACNTCNTLVRTGVAVLCLRDQLPMQTDPTGGPPARFVSKAALT